jgi:hypothetical protein
MNKTLLRVLSSGMRRHVVWQKFIDIDVPLIRQQTST